MIHIYIHTPHIWHESLNTMQLYECGEDVLICCLLDYCPAVCFFIFQNQNHMATEFLTGCFQSWIVMLQWTYLFSPQKICFPSYMSCDNLILFKLLPFSQAGTVRSRLASPTCHLHVLWLCPLWPCSPSLCPFLLFLQLLFGLMPLPPDPCSRSGFSTQPRSFFTRIAFLVFKCDLVSSSLYSWHCIIL